MSSFLRAIISRAIMSRPIISQTDSVFGRILMTKYYLVSKYIVANCKSFFLSQLFSCGNHEKENAMTLECHLNLRTIFFNYKFYSLFLKILFSFSFSLNFIFFFFEFYFQFRQFLLIKISSTAYLSAWDCFCRLSDSLNHKFNFKFILICSNNTHYKNQYKSVDICRR